MALQQGWITLTTDFGIRDPFIGIVKGVIAGINPQARVIDLSHQVAAQDVMAAALILRFSVAFFPPGTIHVAVVDPGVGTTRQCLLIQSQDAYLIGPDNGVLSLALRDKAPVQIVHLSNPTYHLCPPCATFHGRDIFAPVAAYLSLGVAPTAFGETLNSFERIEWPRVTKSTRGIEGKIIYIDGFGNLFTNIEDRDLRGLPTEQLRISLDGIEIHGLSANYLGGDDGRWIALINSWGLLEIARYKDNAAQRSQARVGDRVSVLIL